VVSGWLRILLFKDGFFTRVADLRVRAFRQKELVECSMDIQRDCEVTYDPGTLRRAEKGLLEFIYFLNSKSAPSHSSKTFTANMIAMRFAKKKEIRNKNAAFSVQISI
jgi:hypothetical protein